MELDEVGAVNFLRERPDAADRADRGGQDDGDGEAETDDGENELRDPNRKDKERDESALVTLLGDGLLDSLFGDLIQKPFFDEGSHFNASGIGKPGPFRCRRGRRPRGRRPCRRPRRRQWRRVVLFFLIFLRQRRDPDLAAGRH